MLYRSPWVGSCGLWRLFFGEVLGLEIRETRLAVVVLAVGLELRGFPTFRPKAAVCLMAGLMSTLYECRGPKSGKINQELERELKRFSKPCVYCYVYKYRSTNHSIEQCITQGGRGCLDKGVGVSCIDSATWTRWRGWGGSGRSWRKRRRKWRG